MGAPSTNSRHLLLEDRPPPSTPTVRRLPGKARPRQEVLRECEAEATEMRGYIPRVLWDSPIPDLSVWSVIRHDEPHTSAFWKVTPACGHVEEAIAPSLDWVPASGPRRTAPERVQQMSAESEDVWRANPELQTERDREHTRRMLANGWPMPEPEQLCYSCPKFG